MLVPPDWQQQLEDLLLGEERGTRPGAGGQTNTAMVMAMAMASVGYSGAIVRYNGVIVGYNGPIVQYNGPIVRYNGAIVGYNGDGTFFSSGVTNQPTPSHHSELLVLVL